MALFTPHGLKIRFDEEALEKVIVPLTRSTDFNNLLLDIELWELLPIAMAKVAAIITAFLTGNWLPTLVIGIIGLLIGGVLREITYSDWLRRIFTLFFGHGIVTLVVGISCAIYLVLQGEYLTIFVLATFYILTSIYEIIINILLAPFIYFIGRQSLKKFGVPVTHVERAFIILCNSRANKLGIKLNWSLYAKNNS